MVEHLRFDEFSWKYLPLLSWRKIEQLEVMSHRLGANLQLALFYKSDFMKLNESERKMSMEWLRYKMHPDRWIPFLQILESKDRIRQRNLYRKSLILLQQIAMD